MASITRQTVIAIIAAIAGLFLLLLFATWRFQERIAFQPQRPPYPDAGDTRRIDYKARDGQDLFAYIIGNPDSASGLLITFHGNADVAVAWIPWAHEVVKRTGAAVMLAEYRGYMGLDGRPTYETIALDGQAALRIAADTLGASPDRIAYYGHSLGSAVAAELAVEHRPRVLLLESPFTSAQDMAAVIAGSWLTSGLWRLISRLHFDTVRIVASLDTPVSVIHGGRDRVIPSRMGKTVYDAAKIKGDWLLIPKASHSDVEEVGGEDYWRWFTKALSPLMSQQ
jgi:fermentation-respiration switch protein FrsA (DUF1100 family)